MEVHFYQFTDIFGKTGGGEDAASSDDLAASTGYEVAAAFLLEGGVHIVGCFVIVGCAGLVGAEFCECAADDVCDGRVIFSVDGSYEYRLGCRFHAAKIGNAGLRAKTVAGETCRMAMIEVLTKDGDDAIEDRDADDEDSDKRAVCVFHNSGFVDWEEWITRIFFIRLIIQLTRKRRRIVCLGFWVEKFLLYSRRQRGPLPAGARAGSLLFRVAGP